MRRSLSNSAISALLVTLSLSGFGQCDYVDVPDAPGMSTLYESANGRYMTTSGVVRILIVLAEVEYISPGVDPTPPGGTTGWPAHQLPTWANSLCDWDEPVGTATGIFTRYYQEASSNNFIVLGDYLMAPDNGGVFKVQSTTGSVGPAQAIAAVNSALGTSIVTGHGFSSIDDFDLWNLESPGSGPGEPKITPSTESPRMWDHIMFIWRNSRDNFGNPNDGTGYSNGGSPGTLLSSSANTYSNFGAYNALPVDIMRHEFAHLLYGGNNFHAGGGGWEQNLGHYWIQISGGWSNLGLYNGSLNSWNAWDRQRMGWKMPGQVNEVAARNALNTAEASGDLDPTDPGDAALFLIRRIDHRRFQALQELYTSFE